MTDELIDLIERRNALKARVYHLKLILKSLEDDKHAAIVELAVTKERLCDVEIDISTVENEREKR
jgi:hypothetical protein